MTRVLTFDGERSQKRFEMLYAAIIIGGGAPPRGIEIIRREARILDAFDAASIEQADGAPAPWNAAERLRRVQTGSIVELAQPDFELLKKRLEDAPWVAHASRGVVDAADWLSAAPEKG